MDVLADLLTRARARGALFAHSTMRAPWGLEFTDEEPLSLHAVLEGEVHVHVEGEPPVRLLQGDVVLVSAGGPYRFTHAPGAPARALGEVLSAPGVGRDGRRFDLPGDGPRTVLLCGAYTFEGSVCNSLLSALPPLLALHGIGTSDPALRVALGLLAEEVQRESPGQQTVLDRLLDLLLVYGLRAWFAREESSPPAWYAALDDPAVGAALRALHAAPERPWTVAALAAEAGLSRAAFARRFTDLTGQPPLGYLTRWRMTLAQEALRRPGATLAGVAREVGYGSEYAFASAFKRELGVAPGRWRRERAGSSARAHTA
jgi:AraC-like DNA-binding protein